MTKFKSRLPPRPANLKVEASSALYPDTRAAETAAQFRTERPSSTFSDDSPPRRFGGVFEASDAETSKDAVGMSVAIRICEWGYCRNVRRHKLHAKEWTKMLWTILVILLVLWLLGLVSGYTVGGFVHILLVLALVIFVINLLTGRRSV
jgi:hypothetical protein